MRAAPTAAGGASGPSACAVPVVPKQTAARRTSERAFMSRRIVPQYVPTAQLGYPVAMAQDDDDWVGTPPEGHITRDRANPGFWQQNQKMLAVSGAVLFVLAAVVLVLALS
jgi:hypothetical protein